MPKITDKELEYKSIPFFKEDLTALRALYGSSLGVNKVIRTIVHSFVTQTQAKASQAIDANEAKELLDAE